jgi:ACR3 family arsenite transporter
VFDPVLSKFSFLDRFLPAWILLAMGLGLGLGLGRGITGLSHSLDSAQVTAGVPVPIFVGLEPLIEVPVLVGLVYVSLWTRQHFYRLEEATLDVT